MPNKASSVSLPFRLAACAGLFLVSGLACSIAHAQVRVMATMDTDGGERGGEGAVSKRSLDQYVATLKMNSEQKDAAKTLHEGYLAAFKRAGKERNEAMQELMHNEDDDDRGGMMEAMPKITKKWQEATEKLNKGFFADVKALLTPEQEAVWPKVERARRREVGLRGGQVSGASVDLVEVVESMRLDSQKTDEAGKAAMGAAQVAALAEAVEQYEAEMDRQIAEKDRMLSTIEPWEPGKGFDMAKMQEQMKTSREASAKVRDVNEKNARKIENLLPEAKRTAFASEVKKRSFPRVYRPSKVTRAMEAALKIEDVDSEQKKQIASLMESYERDLVTANEAWAAAIRENDDKEGGSLLSAGGAQVRMRFGDEPEDKGPLADARKARKDLDAKAKERLVGILTPAQREKLPKQTDRAEEGWEGEMVGGEGVVIRRGG